MINSVPLCSFTHPSGLTSVWCESRDGGFLYKCRSKCTWEVAGDAATASARVTVGLRSLCVNSSDNLILQNLQQKVLKA